MSNRTSRYSDILKDKTATPINVYGVGAIGRQVALQLAIMGLTNVSIFDFDDVEEHNLGPQGYKPYQIGMKKVEATYEDMCDQNPDGSYVAYGTDHYNCDVAFLCVDNLEARKKIVEGLSANTIIFDTRMMGNSIVVLQTTKEDFNSTLPKTVVEGRCTARSTLYGASIAASAAIGFWVNDGFRGFVWTHDCAMGMSRTMPTAKFVELIAEDDVEEEGETSEEPVAVENS